MADKQVVPLIYILDCLAKNKLVIKHVKKRGMNTIVTKIKKHISPYVSDYKNDIEPKLQYIVPNNYNLIQKIILNKFLESQISKIINNYHKRVNKINNTNGE